MSATQSNGAPAPLGRILIVEDDEVIRGVVVDVLEEAGYGVEVARDGQEAVQKLDSQIYMVVLLDLNLPKVGGLEVLSVGRTSQPDANFIVMTAFGTVDTAIAAMKLGAFDYLRKPFRTDELLVVVERAREQVELQREIAALRADLGDGTRAKIVGRSPAITRVLRLVKRVAPTRATVLISGDTGTGKELVALEIHGCSPRSKKSFVPVNCSALAEGLLESELFGHVKGAFTGAIQSRRGLIEEAQGGTLFLDEIGTIPRATQVKLLRVLQERVINRVGGREPIAVDFRLIVATNSDLQGLVKAGQFREDLFYRLNVFPIRVPTLSERKEDIPILANHFRLGFARDNEVPAPAFSPQAMARMQAYPWPGNVRELENFVERAVIMYSGAASLPFEPPMGGQAPSDGDIARRGLDRRLTLEGLEREYILATLEETQWRRGAAATLLGIDRRTLYRKLKTYEMEAPVSASAGSRPDASSAEA